MRLLVLCLLLATLTHAEDFPIQTCDTYKDDYVGCTDLCGCVWCESTDRVICLDVGRSVNRTCPPPSLPTVAHCPSTHDTVISIVAFVISIVGMCLFCMIGFVIYQRCHDRTYQRI